MKSPDVNIMENVWKMLSDIIYDGPQCKNVQQLDEKCKEAIKIINNEKINTLKNLYGSIPTRLCEVLKHQGNILKH